MPDGVRTIKEGGGLEKAGGSGVDQESVFGTCRDGEDRVSLFSWRIEESTGFMFGERNGGAAEEQISVAVEISQTAGTGFRVCEEVIAAGDVGEMGGAAGGGQPTV